MIWSQQMVAAMRRHANDAQRNESLEAELEDLPLAWSPVCPPIPPTGSSGIKSLGAAILPMVAPLIVDQDEMK